MAEDLPEEKYDFKPDIPAGSIPEGEHVPTFMELVLGAATGVRYVQAILDGKSPPEGIPKHEEFKNKAELLAYVKTAFADGTMMLETADLSKTIQGPEGPQNGEQFWSDFVEVVGNIHVELLGYYRAMGRVPPAEIPRN